MFRPKTGKRPMPSVVDIGAGQTYTLNVSGTEQLNQAAYDALMGGNIRMEIGGYAMYRDVFGKRRLLVFRGYMTKQPDNTFALQAGQKNNRSN
jgi:hypothetical protein